MGLGYSSLSLSLSLSLSPSLSHPLSLSLSLSLSLTLSLSLCYSASQIQSFGILHNFHFWYIASSGFFFHNWIVIISSVVLHFLLRCWPVTILQKRGFFVCMFWVFRFHYLSFIPNFYSEVEIAMEKTYIQQTEMY